VSVAQPTALAPTQAGRSPADEYFFAAKAKATEKKWDEALALFEEAWRLKPSHDIAGNLGQVALKLGRYKKAATFLDRCLKLFPPTGNTDQRAQIQALFEAARVHVAAVRLHADPQPGELVIDRVEVLGSVSGPMEPAFVDPGTHVVQIRRDGKVVVERSFVAVANATQDVHVEPDNGSLQDQGSNSNASATHELPKGTSDNIPPAVEGDGRSALPVVIGATVSVVGFTSAALLLSAAHSQVQSANGYIAAIGNDHCPSRTHDSECQALHEANVRADARYNWGHAMLGVGAAALLTTVGYVLWPKSSSAGHSATAASIRLDCERGSAVLSWLGDF
jgi:hypothetical protein